MSHIHPPAMRLVYIEFLYVQDESITTLNVKLLPHELREGTHKILQVFRITSEPSASKGICLHQRPNRLLIIDHPEGISSLWSFISHCPHTSTNPDGR